MKKEKTSSIKSFTGNFWTAISMEFLERGAYYGVMSVLGVFLILTPLEGGSDSAKNRREPYSAQYLLCFIFYPLLQEQLQTDTDTERCCFLPSPV